MRMNVSNGKSMLYAMGLFALLFFSQASQAEVTTESPHFLPTTSTDARWVFSGVVASEEGKQYGYFFQMERRGQVFHSHAALFDVQTKALLLQDESETELTTPSSNHWHVGHAFLQFNPINDSWVFGFKQANKAGFNFKVDMLKPAEALPVGQGLRPGIDVLVSQAHSLNGHIYDPDGAKEMFVTAKHAWFREMAITKTQPQINAVKGVLCRFNDDSGFYSVNLPTADAIRGAIAGRFDAEGLAAPMSQFIHVEALENGQWTIRVPSPNQKVTISSFLKQASMISGIAEVGDRTGFCLLSEDTVDKTDADVQTV
ncbi:MAG: hypothetical protein P1U32_06490 [Legionellaceae bacterium]|nr:hypothetical protein [Legionellaceae bacterium]